MPHAESRTRHTFWPWEYCGEAEIPWRKSCCLRAERLFATAPQWPSFFARTRRRSHSPRAIPGLRPSNPAHFFPPVPREPQRHPHRQKRTAHPPRFRRFPGRTRFSRRVGFASASRQARVRARRRRSPKSSSRKPLKKSFRTIVAPLERVNLPAYLVVGQFPATAYRTPDVLELYFSGHRVYQALGAGATFVYPYVLYRAMAGFAEISWKAL